MSDGLNYIARASLTFGAYHGCTLSYSPESFT
jgi:hypothetical protein